MKDVITNYSVIQLYDFKGALVDEFRINGTINGDPNIPLYNGDTKYYFVEAHSEIEAYCVHYTYYKYKVINKNF